MREVIKNREGEIYMSKVIKKGYYLEITTWENDGDNYKTKIMDGLSEAEARHYKGFTDQFHSKYAGAAGLNLGNSEIDYYVDDEMSNQEAYLIKSCHKYLLDVDTHGHGDIVFDVVNTWCNGEYYRVVESCKVFFNPSEVIMAGVEFNSPDW